MKFNLSSINTQNIKKGLDYIKNNGLNGVMSRVRYKMSGPGAGYNEWYKNVHRADAEELERQRETSFAYEPTISILVPVYMTSERMLRAMIESVQAQTYGKWQLCIADGSPAEANVGSNMNLSGQSVRIAGSDAGNVTGNADEDNSGNSIIQEQDGVVFERTYSRTTERIISQYMAGDDRISYRMLDENLGISENTNRALEMATGEYIALLDHDDVLAEDALYCVVQALQEEKYDALYSDEDKMSEDGNKFSDPALKPDFSPDLLRAHNYITHFFVAKRSLAVGVGGFHREYDGAQDYDFILRCSENALSIKHIPRVLYHWRISNTSVAADPHSKEYAREAGRLALAEHLKRMGYYATVAHTDMWGIYKVTYETLGNPILSIVMPGGKDIALMKKCLMPLYEKARYSNFEIIIVDNIKNISQEKSVYYHKLESKRKNVKVVSYEGTDGISGIRNHGASFAAGDYILFLDSNIEIIDPTAIGEMLGICMRGEDVGAVGGTIYDDRNITCYEGMAIGVNGPYSIMYKGVRKDDFGYLMHNRVNFDCSAVSASCLMVRKSLFDKVGGFSDKFRTELVDIDFCLRLRELNKLIVCAADAGWSCHTVTTAGAQAAKETPFAESEEALAKREEDLFHILWAQILKDGDPYYNPNFIRNGDLFALK